MITKLIVTGGRDYADETRVFATLEMLSPTQVVHGDAMGADALALRWVLWRNHRARQAVSQQIPHPADWDTHGRAAGPIRNQEMVDCHPDAQMLVAFPGGRGTADMIRRAKKAGLPVLTVA